MSNLSNDSIRDDSTENYSEKEEEESGKFTPHFDWT